MNCTPFSIQLPFSDTTDRFVMKISAQKVTLEQVLEDKTRFPKIELPIEANKIYKIEFKGGYPNTVNIGLSGLNYLRELDESDNDDKLSIINGKGIVMIAGDTPFQEVWFKSVELDGKQVIRYKTVMQPFI